MSYQVLARKWRPANFRQMVGQEHVLQALVNALDHDRLHHAYLFTGTRGVGKTTIARILAKCLNCETGVSSEPCGECGACLEIAEGRSVDLLEVDAASRTKVEDTRELLENVQYAPTSARFKVYLIDEVHMLSSHSFNALLKTLEEPPPHVKFLLATTDPQKLPATILSRCLQFNLKNMPPEQIVSHLQTVLQAEMVEFEEPALWLLGRAAAGSMRDALSLTDQAIAYGSGKLLETEVRAMLGTIDLSYVYQLLHAVASGDPARPLEVVAQMAEHGPDYEATLDELISLIHRAALAQAVPTAVDNSWGDAERVRDLAANFTAEDAQLFYQVAINGKRDLPQATDARSGLEMTLLRMVAFRPQAVWDDQASPADLQELPASTQEAGPSAPVNEPSAPANEPSAAVNEPSAAVKEPSAPVNEPSAGVKEPSAPAQEPPAEPAPPSTADAAGDPPGKKPQPAQPEPVAAPRQTPAASPAPAGSEVSLHPDFWYQLQEQLSLSGIVTAIASHCQLVSVAGDTCEFILDERHSALYRDSQAGEIQAALGDYFQRAIAVNLTIAVPSAETPAMRSERLGKERQAEAVAAIENDPVVKQLIERFDGELEPNSIAPITD